MYEGRGGVAGKRRDKEREQSERGAGCLSWEQVSVQFGVGWWRVGGGAKTRADPMCGAPVLLAEVRALCDGDEGAII